MYIFCTLHFDPLFVIKALCKQWIVSREQFGCAAILRLLLHKLCDQSTQHPTSLTRCSVWSKLWCRLHGCKISKFPNFISFDVMVWWQWWGRALSTSTKVIPNSTVIHSWRLSLLRLVNLTWVHRIFNPIWWYTPIHIPDRCEAILQAITHVESGWYLGLWIENAYFEAWVGES